MLHVAVTSVILAVTLMFCLAAVLVPIKCNLTKLLNPPDDNFISSRNTQSWISVGFSLYAGAVGTWVLMAPVESGATASWGGVIGYAIGCGLPWMIFWWSGTKLRRMMPNRGFTSLEFVHERLGRPMQIVVASMSIIYLVAMLTAELMAIGTCLQAISPNFPPLAATLSVAIVTNFYSALGGFPVSVLTDKIQAVVAILLIVIAYGGMFSTVFPQLNAEHWKHASTCEFNGAMTGFILIVSCFIVEQLSQTTWQRVFSARTESDMNWGFGLGILLMFPSMLLFGFVGIVGHAAHNAEYIDYDFANSGQVLFLLIAKMGTPWLVLIAVLAIILVTSTADTIQTGLSAIIAGELTDRRLSLNWARAFSLLLNIPAVLAAALAPPSVLHVMMATNILTVAVVPSVLLGFTEYVTPIGALLGVVGASGSIYFQGWMFTGGPIKAFAWSTFPYGFNWNCLVTFLVVPFIGAMTALVISQIEFYLDPTKLQEQRDCLVEIMTKGPSRTETDSAVPDLKYNRQVSIVSTEPSIIGLDSNYRGC